MNAHHQRHKLNELRRELMSLRPLAPDGPRYKLWLGDLVEFVHAAFGPATPQMAQVRAILTGGARPPADADEITRTRAYVARLDAFAALLDAFQRSIRDPIMLVDLRTDGSDARRN